VRERREYWTRSSGTHPPTLRKSNFLQRDLDLDENDNSSKSNKKKVFQFTFVSKKEEN